MTTDQTPVDINTLLASGTVTNVQKMFGQDAKEQLAEAGTPFIVNEIQMGDDADFGPYWEVHATLEGSPISFRLSQHERRDAFMQGLAGVVTNQPISGLRLRAYSARGGNKFVTLEPA